VARITRSSRSARVISVVGALTLIAGLVLLMTSAIAGAATTQGVTAPLATQNVALHNNTTNTIDCPINADSAASYWHFVITPNNGTYSFVTILAGTVMFVIVSHFPE
jgi:hypothetical protein